MGGKWEIVELVEVGKWLNWLNWGLSWRKLGVEYKQERKWAFPM